MGQGGKRDDQAIRLTKREIKIVQSLQRKDAPNLTWTLAEWAFHRILENPNDRDAWILLREKSSELVSVFARSGVEDLDPDDIMKEMVARTRAAEMGKRQAMKPANLSPLAYGNYCRQQNLKKLPKLTMEEWIAEHNEREALLSSASSVDPIDV